MRGIMCGALEWRWPAPSPARHKAVRTDNHGVTDGRDRIGDSGHVRDEAASSWHGFKMTCSDHEVTTGAYTVSLRVTRFANPQISNLSPTISVS